MVRDLSLSAESARSGAMRAAAAAALFAAGVWLLAVAAPAGAAGELYTVAGYAQPGKVQTSLLTSLTLNGNTISLAQATPPQTGKVNPAKFCSALRTKMGGAAFNELWGTNVNSKNAFGTCVSTVAHARNAGKTEQQITDAVTAGMAKGLKGAALGAFVAAKDGVAATKTEAQERAAAHASHGHGHGKKT